MSTVDVRLLHIPCGGCGRDYPMVVPARHASGGRPVEESLWASYQEGLITVEDLIDLARI